MNELLSLNPNSRIILESPLESKSYLILPAISILQQENLKTGKNMCNLMSGTYATIYFANYFYFVSVIAEFETACSISW